MAHPIILEWLARMEANTDRQIRGQLSDGCGGFCVEGLLCDIMVHHGLGEWKQETPSTKPYYTFTPEGQSFPFESSVEVSFKAMEQIGVREDIARELSYLLLSSNDAKEKTFPEIAATVRYQYGVHLKLGKRSKS